MNQQFIEVGELGAYSMASIIAALKQYESKGEAEYDSDSSWTVEDEIGTFYVDIQKQLQAFLVAADQYTLITREFSRRERRVVHNVAHLLQLQHVTIRSDRRYCQMRISKPSATAKSDIDLFGTSFNEQESFLSFLPDNQAETDAMSTNSGLPGKKRKRQPKTEGGFICSNCGRAFDRASERTKHEQAHQPAVTNRYKCSQCDKGFRYPKDLRRHQKIHVATVSTATITDLPAPSSTSGRGRIGSSTPSPPEMAENVPQNFAKASKPQKSSSTSSALTSALNSRSSSLTSMTDSSAPISTSTSPDTLFGRQLDDMGFQLDLDPLVLGDSAWSGYWGESIDSGFRDLCGHGDDEDYPFLEMARSKKG